ncbi:MAG: HpaII family restriction endonuclease [Candidatus Falkowbacteria bacterium]|nr:HpaII family restriction endonuclease [Candidatus Falkowbacteria bacterium]
MNNKKQTTGNVGEWSELYALAFLLANGGVYGADKNQNRKEDLFYKVLKIIFAEKIGKEKMTYEINDKVIDIFTGTKKLTSIKVQKIQSILKKMFESLSAKNEGRAFPLVAGSEMMQVLQKEIIKASSYNKKDLDLVVFDVKTKRPSPEIGFSIKSQLGSPSTLINASKATNFTFEVLDANMKIPKDLPKLHDKNVKDNINLLINSGFNIVFNKVDSNTFQNNLSLIDSNLPAYIAKILLSYYSKDANNLSPLVNLNFPTTDKQSKQPTHKIKEFLSIMALGMMPNTDWNGILTSLGGFLLVKKDGDVLCYYLYNLEDFQEYLLNNTKLDTPSTTRYGIGKIIEENGRFFIKLNLQVRFIK